MIASIEDDYSLSPAQYISRPPVSLKRIRCEPVNGRLIFYTTHSGYFGENTHLFAALDSLAELTQHIPPKGTQVSRRYGLYSSRTSSKLAVHRRGSTPRC